MNYMCVRIEGGLLSPDFLERIHDVEGQRPADFGLTARRSLVDEISSIYGDARVYWTAFQRRRERATASGGRQPLGESITTVTREQWIIPLLELLGYRLTFQRRAVEVDGRTYALSHRASDHDEAPAVHVVGIDQELGTRPPAGRGTLSPHALVQDYLNRSEDLWGIVTNGGVLRLLRDSSYLTRSAYIEFDLQQMLEGDRLDEFILFYRLGHRTRLPQTIQDAPQCLLERYYQHALEQGGRIRDGLRDAVEQAVLTLANGFLKHPRNEALRERILAGQLTPRQFYHQLLYLVYRLLFLLVAEERDLLLLPGPAAGKGAGSKADLFRAHFSLTRLRVLAEEPLSAPERFDDLYLGLRTLFYVLGDERRAAQLGLAALNGKLFDLDRDIDAAYLNNRDLLAAIGALSYFVPAEERVRRRVNYAALDVEELGSVYESLLDLHPDIENTAGRLTFRFGAGTERKTTGSYYTRPELVGELVTSALEPVMQERLSGARTREQKEKALLSLKVCDPACGSGHFLLAAARRIGRELARIRTESDEPAPEAVREAVRDVITHCIYGVDKNPLAVDLCKVALWIEGHTRGKPLTFLDHRIRCGDSLVGVLDLAVLRQGVPDEAFEPVTGDDKPLARSLKRQNRHERRGQASLPFDVQEELNQFALRHSQFADLPDDTSEQVRKKAAAFQRIHGEGTRWWEDNTACHLWTAAFFTELTRKTLDNQRVPTTESLRRYLQTHAIDGRLVGQAWALAHRLTFFHWALEFPEVFLPSPSGRGAGGEGGGFDVVLSNPPWERIKLQEQEFFATRDPEIARAPNKAARQRLIQQLPERNPQLWQEYQEKLHDAEALSKFLRHSGRFPLTARGDINTYAVFAELIRRLLGPKGRSGMVVPTGIATDDTNKHFFTHLVQAPGLVSLFDFENREGLFPAVDSRMKFSLLTMSKPAVAQSDFAFFCTRAEHLKDDERRFTLTPEDLALLNPNTRTCPVFRTRADAELTKAIYRRVPVLVNESLTPGPSPSGRGEGEGGNPWGVRFRTMFHMANDSGLFRTAPGEGLLPLYEAKMMWQFDHRFGTYEGVCDRNSTHLPTPTPERYADPKFVAQPWYWVPGEEVETRLADWPHRWLLGFRDITNATNERTAIFSLLPRVGVGHKAPLIFAANSQSPTLTACLLANFNSFVVDYCARSCRQ